MSSPKRNHRSQSPRQEWPREDDYEESQPESARHEDNTPDETEAYRRAPPSYAQHTTQEKDRLGDLLRSARQQRGENLYTISDFLRIRPTFLAALENSRYEEFPADAYVIGFLRTYANYLGLDSVKAIEQYRREMAGRRRKPQLNMPQPISEGRAPTAAILIGATAAVLLLYALWYGLSSSSRTAVDAPPPMPQTAQVSPEPAPTTTAVNETPAVIVAAPESPPSAATAAPVQANPKIESITLPVAMPPAEPLPAKNPVPETLAVAEKVMPEGGKPADQPKPRADEIAAIELPPLNDAGQPKRQVYGSASGSRIVVRAEKETWVLVADKNGNTVFDKIMNPGDVYNVPGTKGLRLTTGNGSGIVLSVDGIDLPPLGADSRIVRNVPLDGDKLKERKTPTAD